VEEVDGDNIITRSNKHLSIHRFKVLVETETNSCAAVLGVAEQFSFQLEVSRLLN
jgi:hypothetical protein